MYLPTKSSELLIDLATKLRGLSNLICTTLPAAGEMQQLPADTDIFIEIPSTVFMRLVEGEVEYHLSGKTIMHFETGDLLGLPRSLNLPQGIFYSRTPVKVEFYERDQLIDHVNKDLKIQRHWAHYLLCYQSLLEHALAQELRAPFQPSTGFLHFQAGDTIIRQGDTADRVYTLLEGSADALCDGVKVGDIKTNEIFGALAVFTRQPRMASIVATSDATLLAVPKEEFVDLIEHQPQICVSLIEEMAAKINQLNNQLRDLTEKATNYK